MMTRNVAVACRVTRTRWSLSRPLAFIAALVISVPTPAAGECVVLLHGLARTARSMQALEAALGAEHYNVINVDYPSREKTIEQLAPDAITQGLDYCADKHSEPVHFVTHSMGGILVRYYLEHHEIANLGRVVMIAPPNQGSEVVDNLANVPGFALVNGPAGLQLGTDDNSIPARLGPVDYAVGVIAGSTTFNPILSQFLPNPDDGKVSVEKTKVDGMADFVVVEVSHPFIMQDETVLEYTRRFLRTGSFGATPP